MRDIKFRAWEKSLKEMIPVYNIDFESKIINTNSAWRMFDEVELMQYTGLKDKNGKEIYEGDVCSYLPKNAKHIYFETKWDDGYVTFIITAYKPFFHSLRFGFDIAAGELEVIGNIYENPELLTWHINAFHL